MERMNRWGRLLRHVFTPPQASLRIFSDAAFERIEKTIGQQEDRHRGQIVFAVEASLPWSYLKRHASARERALMQFSKLRVWDTDENCGVLIYLLLADHDVEIVADRAAARRIGQTEWETVCRGMEAAFRAGRFEEGAIEGIKGVGDLLAQHFPSNGAARDELSNAPVRL